jgi:hypothetical protein
LRQLFLETLDGTPISSLQEVIQQGTPAILEYLQNQAWWHLQQMMPSMLLGLSFVALIDLGLTWRYRGQRKAKAKRE